MEMITIDKPDIISSDSCSSSSIASLREQYPGWVTQFYEEILDLCGSRDSRRLDSMMNRYINEIKQEVLLCSKSPYRAAYIVHKMGRILVFFYLYYTNVKQFFLESQWTENIVDILSMYCHFELKASLRANRKDSAFVISSRIVNTLLVYLESNHESITHVILKIQGFGRRHKEIFDPIFRKLLVEKKPKQLSDLDYIRYLLAFKLWKRLYSKDEKKFISEIALSELRAPRSFLRNYRNFKFLPPIYSHANIHSQLVTGLIDLDKAILDYFCLFNQRVPKLDFTVEQKKDFWSEFFYAVADVDCLGIDFESYLFESKEEDTFANNEVEEIIDLTDDCIEIDKIEIKSDIEEDKSEKSDKSDDLKDKVTLKINLIDIPIEEDSKDSDINMSVNGFVLPSWCLDINTYGLRKLRSPPLKIFADDEDEIPLTPEKIELEPVTAPDVETIVEPEPVPEPEPESEMEEIDVLKHLEDNSNGLTEITSTSHPINDTNNSMMSLSNSTDFFLDQMEKELRNENFEHVDSTSNINEEDCEPDLESPIVKAFMVEGTVEDGVVCSAIVSEIIPTDDDKSEKTGTTISNSVFEEFASTQNGILLNNKNSNIEINRTSTSVVSEEILAENIITQIVDVTNTDSLLLDKDSESSHNSQSEVDDLVSPAMEPLSGKEYKSYLATLNASDLQDAYASTSDLQDAFASTSNLQDPFASTSDLQEPYASTSDYLSEDIELNKKRKMKEQGFRTYSKKSLKLSSSSESRSPSSSTVASMNHTNSSSSTSSSSNVVNLPSGSGLPISLNVFPRSIVADEPKPSTSKVSASNPKGVTAAKYSISKKSTVKTSKSKSSSPKPSTSKASTSKPLSSSSSSSSSSLSSLSSSSSDSSSSESESSVPSPKQEKVFRLGSEVWENIFKESLSLSQRQYTLFAPIVKLRKEDPKQYIPKYEKSNTEDLTFGKANYDPKQEYQQYINYTNSPKKILERQDFLKPANCEGSPRVRVMKRPFVERNEPSTSKGHKTPDLVIQTRNKYSVSPDVNINLTLPKFQSVSLNSSFQHHFCTDISTCTSSCDTFPKPTENTCPINDYTTSTQQHPVTVESENLANTSTVTPILPAEVPYWHEINPESQDNVESSSQSSDPNVLVNINLDQCNTDHEIHLPIKKRRVSNLKLEIKDELSYPPTPMISIAALEETKQSKIRNCPFKTPAELKEMPPLPTPYICNPVHVIPENYNTNRVYNTPTINYRVHNVPVINFQYNTHYQLPSIQPILLPVNSNPSASWDSASYDYVKVPVATAKPETSTENEKKKSTPQVSRTNEKRLRSETVPEKQKKRTKSKKPKPTPPKNQVTRKKKINNNSKTAPWRFSP